MYGRLSTYLADPHINASIVLSNIEVKVFILYLHVPTFRKFTFEPLRLPFLCVCFVCVDIDQVVSVCKSKSVQVNLQFSHKFAAVFSPTLFLSIWMIFVICWTYPPSLVPNSSNRSVNASLNSIIPWAGIAICDRGPPRVIVWDTCKYQHHFTLSIYPINIRLLEMESHSKYFCTYS